MCKCREAFSLAVLIGRGLDHIFNLNLGLLSVSYFSPCFLFIQFSGHLPMRRERNVRYSFSMRESDTSEFDELIGRAFEVDVKSDVSVSTKICTISSVGRAPDS